jgi:hypothetical protein
VVNAERQRLYEADTRDVAWRRWGPYFSERQWGTVREACSGSGATDKVEFSITRREWSMHR